MSQPSPSLPSRRRALDDMMQRHGSIVLMLTAQLCSAVLATIARILRTGHGEHESEAMGTAEILLFMMITTMLLSWTYITLFNPHSSSSSSSSSADDAPMRNPETRLLLIIRGVAGFFGIWGFYYSLRYLALAEATIINFLAPILAVLLLGLFPGQRLSVAQLLAGFVSMGGVVCVLQPWSADLKSVSTEHAVAVAAAFVGVLGGAVSYLVITRLGDRVHPILTVAWFSTFCVVLSGLLLLVQWQKLRLPTTPLQWFLGCILGVLGFTMHWLMTTSLTRDSDSKRPLNFIYTQIVFAMLADKLVWNVSPDAWKYVGGAVIICSAVFVASTKANHQYARVQSDAEGEDEDELELEASKERDETAIELVTHRL